MSYNAGNQLTKMESENGSIKYAYDANGNLTSKSSALGIDSYTYNAQGLLDSFIGYDGYAQNYTYGASGLLSTKTSSGDANRLTMEEVIAGKTLSGESKLQDETTSYVWDLTRRDGMLLSETTNGSTTNYSYGLERIAALNGKTKTEYLYDGRGSVAAELTYTDTWYNFGGALSKVEAKSPVLLSASATATYQRIPCSVV